MNARKSKQSACIVAMFIGAFLGAPVHSSAADEPREPQVLATPPLGMLFGSLNHASRVG